MSVDLYNISVCLADLLQKAETFVNVSSLPSNVVISEQHCKCVCVCE